MRAPLVSSWLQLNELRALTQEATGSHEPIIREAPIGTPSDILCNALQVSDEQHEACEPETHASASNEGVQPARYIMYSPSYP